jgi:sortase B
MPRRLRRGKFISRQLVDFVDFLRFYGILTSIRFLWMRFAFTHYHEITGGFYPMKKKIFLKLAAMCMAILFIASPLSLGAQSATGSAAPKSSVYTHKSIKSWIAKYAADNPDVKGYLVVPGTSIAKPITYNSKDNSYYTYRDIKGINYPNTAYNNFGETAIYLDYRTKFGDTWKDSSRNTVLYGHNWTNLREPLDIGADNNHIMFGQLPSYTNIDFAKENPHIYFSTGENEGIWRVFCVAYVELSKNFNYNAPNPKLEEYEKLLGSLKSRSMYDFDVELSTSDRILTLSTCTRQYNVGSQQRFIVVARLLRNGESEKDAVKVTVNKDMKQPQF